MPILSMIFSALSGPILDKLIQPMMHLFDSYMNKQITEAQLREQLQALMLQTFKDIEVAHTEAITKMFSVFMDTARQSPLMMKTWAFVTISQGCMLLWFQIGIPFIVAIHLVDRWPSAGSTAEWTYALVGGCLGLGMTLGKTSGGVTGALKSLVGK